MGVIEFGDLAIVQALKISTESLSPALLRVFDNENFFSFHKLRRNFGEKIRILAFDRESQTSPIHQDVQSLRENFLSIHRKVRAIESSKVLPFESLTGSPQSPHGRHDFQIDNGVGGFLPFIPILLRDSRNKEVVIPGNRFIESLPTILVMEITTVGSFVNEILVGSRQFHRHIPAPLDQIRKVRFFVVRAFEDFTVIPIDGLPIGA